jgi:hypothetical protein
LATLKNAVNTGKKQATNGSWKLGESGNLKGRPKGARNKFSTQFFEDFLEVWSVYGKLALEQAIKKDPVAFMNTAARLVSKEVEVDFSKVKRFAGFQFIVSGKKRCGGSKIERKKP